MLDRADAKVIHRFIECSRNREDNKLSFSKGVRGVTPLLYPIDSLGCPRESRFVLND